MTIKITFRPKDRFARCIYKISFGERFYIGAADWLERRMRSHKSTINRLLAGTLQMNEKNDYYCHIITHLQKYPEIVEGIVTVLEEVPRDVYIFDVEKKWKRQLSRDGMCLNTTELQYYTEAEIDELQRQLDG
jgi:hypothetical protein